MALNERGHEIPDPIPVEVPIQWRRPPTIQEQIKAMVRRELSEAASAQGMETFEEADDFDVDDDFDPTSPYEENFDVEAPPSPNATLSNAAPVPEGSSVSPASAEGVPAVSNGSGAGATPTNGKVAGT